MRHRWQLGSWLTAVLTVAGLTVVGSAQAQPASSGISFAIREDSALPIRLTRAQLRLIYDCGLSTGTVRPLLPPFGSATRRSFVTGVLGLTDSATFTQGRPCVSETTTSNAPLREDTGNLLSDPRQIVPYSVPRWAGQVNRTEPDVHGRTVLGTVDGIVPILPAVGVGYAIRADSALPAGLTQAQLGDIYACRVAESTVRPMLPAFGSATRRTFVEQVLGLTDSATFTATRPCISEVAGGAPLPENNGAVLSDARQIVPYAASRWVAQVVRTEQDRHGRTVLGSIDGAAPISANPATATATPTPTPSPAGTGRSMQFRGTGSGGIDRVLIPLTTDRTVDVGGDLTLEWWMRPSAGNAAGPCRDSPTLGDEWIYGNIVLDRDVYGQADQGDYGISLYGDGRLSFGVAGTVGATVCSTVGVTDGAWHHVAATRNAASGQICLYVDGVQSGCRTGPTGDIGYRDGRETAFPASDPFLVIGAEKHDAGTDFPSYRGLLDELRVSSTVRYNGTFPVARSAFGVDASTAALYHFDEGSGTALLDATGRNPGDVRVGGTPSTPAWSTDQPFPS